jgi:hypothetical protein
VKGSRVAFYRVRSQSLCAGLRVSVTMRSGKFPFTTESNFEPMVSVFVKSEMTQQM